MRVEIETLRGGYPWDSREVDLPDARCSHCGEEYDEQEIGQRCSADRPTRFPCMYERRLRCTGTIVATDVQDELEREAAGGEREGEDR